MWSKGAGLAWMCLFVWPLVEHLLKKQGRGQERAACGSAVNKQSVDQGGASLAGVCPVRGL